MTVPKKQRDVLDDLLCGTGAPDGEMPPEIEQLSQLIDPLLGALGGKSGRGRKSDRTAGTDPGETGQEGTEGSLQRQAAKKKTTYYLSMETAASLAEIQMRIQQLLPGKVKRRLSKSRIVEHALKQIMAEFEKREKESLLVKWILELPEED